MDEPPYIYLGGVGYLLGECSKAKSQALVRSGLQQRDAAVASGDADRLHKVTHRLSVSQTGQSPNPHQLALEAFASTSVDSPDCNLELDTAVVLRDYTLGKVVTRKTEAQHALIGMYQAKKVSSLATTSV